MQYGMFCMNRCERSGGQESVFETPLHQTAHTDAHKTYRTAYTTARVGMQGRICDNGVFLNSSFYNTLKNGPLH